MSYESVHGRYAFDQMAAAESERDDRLRARHTPGRQCDKCEGFCLRAATIDEAMTALTVARTQRERLAACESLADAAQTTARHLRAAIAKAEAA